MENRCVHEGSSNVLAPRKPLSAYFLWCVEERRKVAAELGNLSPTMVSKELGRRWSLVEPDTKARFEELAVEERRRYTEAMRSYKPSAEFMQRVKAAQGPVKKIKDPNAPKRPASAYLLWCGEERARVKAELGPLPTPEMTKELLKRWLAVEPETRARQGYTFYLPNLQNLMREKREERKRGKRRENGRKKGERRTEGGRED